MPLQQDEVLALTVEDGGGSSGRRHVLTGQVYCPISGPRSASGCPVVAPSGRQGSLPALSLVAFFIKVEVQGRDGRESYQALFNCRFNKSRKV